MPSPSDASSGMSMENRMALTAGVCIGTLGKIVYNFHTPEKLRETCKEFGLEYEKELELAYEHMQSEAKATLEELKELNGGKS